MRISDWSSDVCSSDLHLSGFVCRAVIAAIGECAFANRLKRHRRLCITNAKRRLPRQCGPCRACETGTQPECHKAPPTLCAATGSRSVWEWRSEEHTSELQSLMRISYAVFCLKKK